MRVRTAGQLTRSVGRGGLADLFTRQLSSPVLRLIIGAALSHSFSAPAHALPQIATLDGRVSDERNSAIADAVCTLTGRMLPGGGLTVSSNREGKFHFLQLPPGPYKVACAAMGY